MNQRWLDSLTAHLQAGHLSRRDFVKRAAALGFSAPVIGAVLAACGGDDDEDTPETTAATPTTAAPGAEPTATQGVTIQQNITPTAGASPAAGSSPTAVAPTGAAGGAITVSRQVDSENLDPVMQDGNINIWVFMSIYDQLIRIDTNGTALLPGLATEWDISDDGMTYTFTIREGVKFSNGTDMTVDDIKWSIERARDTEDSPWTFSLAQVASVDTPDDTTVQITLTEPWSPFLSDISMFNSSVVSKAFADEVGVEGLVDQCMGTGPFALQEWRKAESMTLVKNENYWEEGLPLLDQITYTVVPDVNAQILQLQGGEVDGIIGQGDVPFNRVEELDADPNIQVIRSLSTYNNFLVLQTQHEPLDDVHVRRALNYATDKQAIIDTILFGNAEVSNSFMPNGALFWNADQEGYPFDLDKAREELAQSKAPDGFEVEIQIRSGNDQQSAIATAVQAMWSQIGVTVNILPLEATVLAQNNRDENFAIRITGWTNDIIDPDQLVSYAILPETTNNYHTGWQSQEAIDLANEGRAEQDPDARRQIYYQIQQIHRDEAPFVYLYVVPYVDALLTR
ncbi:MAG TPA: ABC transporter substrate-binding protein, partial [Thermomicrobiales bacterium]|nr:ABC transporter substrate-binding protein [Thermomicrobiales bacterium]